MKPGPQPRDAFDLFQAHFDRLLDPHHELVQPAKQIDWPRLARASQRLPMPLTRALAPRYATRAFRTRAGPYTARRAVA